MRKRKISSVLFEKWQPAVIIVVGISALLGLFFYKFATIAPSIQASELNVLQRGLTDILREPLHLHQQIIQKLAAMSGMSNLLAVRLTPALNATLSVAAFYLIVRTWFTRRMALMGGFLFATSSWLLHAARIGLTDANYLLITVPVLALIMLQVNKYSLRGSLLLLLSGVTLLYVPGFIWLVVPVMIWRRKLIIDSVRHLSPWVIGVVSLCIVFGVLPLIVALASDPGFILKIAGLPNDLSALSQAPAYFVEGVREIFFWRDPNALLGIGTVAYFNIATSVLVLLGVVQSYEERKLDRTKVVAITCLVGFVLHGISLGAVSLVFVMPFLFLYATKGLVFLLQRWLHIFPRNPFAEKVALLSLVLVLAGIGTYELTRYYIAWPHSDGYAEIFDESKS